MTEIDRKEFKDNLFSVITSSTFITLFISVLFYIIIASYYINFFDRLSLPFYSLNLPFSFYISAGYNLFGIIFYLSAYFFVSFIIFIPNKYLQLPRLENASDFLKLNLIHLFGLIFLWIWMVILVWLSEFSLPLAFKNHFFDGLISISPKFIISFYFWIVSIGAEIFLMGLFFALLGYVIGRLEVLLKNNKKILFSNPFVFLYLITGILLIISCIYFLPAKLGYYAAQDVIDGNSDSLTLNLSLKDKNSSLNNLSFTLISYCNDNYYLIKTESDVSKNASAKLYIIPKDQVQLAIGQNVERGK